MSPPAIRKEIQKMQPISGDEMEAPQPRQEASAFREILAHAVTGASLTGLTALESYGGRWVLAKLYRGVDPRMIFTIAESATILGSRIFGRSAADAVARICLAGGATAGIKLTSAFFAGVTLGVGLEYLPTVWGGPRTSHHLANGLEFVLGQAPKWLLVADDKLNEIFRWLNPNS